MANQKISQMPAITAAELAASDLLAVVDVSDVSQASSGSNKKITVSDLQSAAVSSGTANGVLYLNGSKVATSGSALTFDASGNLGLGVTPSAWGAFNSSIDISTVGNVSSDSATLRLARNWYADSAGTPRYKTNGAAHAYLQNPDLGHVWYTAPSGTAGQPISFTQAMTLDASGNLLVGCTTVVHGQQGVFLSPDAGNRYLCSTSSGTSYQLQFVNSNGSVGSITTSGTSTAYNTSSDYRLKNITGPVTNSGQYIDALKPVEGTWKADGSTFVGLIAHEVQEVSRTQVATGEKDGEQMQAMDYSNSELIANLIAEVQALRKRVAQLETSN